MICFSDVYSYFCEEQTISQMKTSNSVNVFQVTNLPILGAQHYKSTVYTDNRGSIYESFHVLKMNFASSVDSVRGVYPIPNIVYGPVSHNGEELIYLIRGKLQVQLVDSNDFSNKFNLDMESGDVLKIPSMCIHTFLSLIDDTIFDIVRSESLINQIHYELNDSKLGLTFPEGVKQAPHKHPEPIRPDYAIMGSNGLIGSAFVREIESRGQTWVQIRSRLHQHESIENEILNINPKISVIIAAGVGTRPNTKWCETHRMETVDANVTSQLAIAQICKRHNIHCTLIGTSAFYHYDEEHPMGGKGFTEEDPSNHDANFYYEMRTLLEKLLHETGLENSTLNLRAIFPLDHKLTSASLIGKLLKFSSINVIPTSLTVLTDLVPLALDMMKDKEVGKVNWVCEGTMSNGDILRAYQSIVDPSIIINEKIVDVETSFKTGNAAAYIIPKRLYEKFGNRVPKVQDSINKVMNLIKEEKK